MASDDEKIKTNSAAEHEAPPENKSTSSQRHPRLTAEKQLPPHPPAIVGAKARNPFLKLIGRTGT